MWPNVSEEFWGVRVYVVQKPRRKVKQHLRYPTTFAQFPHFAKWLIATRCNAAIIDPKLPMQNWFQIKLPLPRAVPFRFVSGAPLVPAFCLDRCALPFSLCQLPTLLFPPDNKYGPEDLIRFFSFANLPIFNLWTLSPDRTEPNWTEREVHWFSKQQILNALCTVYL